MEEQVSCAIIEIMLQKLLMYGTFLVREGADMEAAGMLLGGIDMLRCKGPVQDIPGDVPGGHLAFVWIFQGLKNVQDTESVFGALRALQVHRHTEHLFMFKNKRVCEAVASVLQQVAEL